MQHYGLPTRLLDITINPLIALYFSCEEQENAELEPGYIYMYIRKGKKLDDPSVRLLSLLSCKNISTIDDLVLLYNEVYDDSISIDEVSKFISSPVFVKYTEVLTSSNNRLGAQMGTFVLCGNHTNEKELITLDILPPVMIFRVPAEYKQAIRKELDDSYSINVTTVYPEFSSGAAYLRAKYRKNEYVIDKNDYKIFNVEQKNHSFRRQVDIRIVIKKPLPIRIICEIAKLCCSDYTGSNDVIWIYIAMSDEDVIMVNWRVRGIWINPEWANTGIRPLRNVDTGGYSWEYYSGSSIRNEFNNEHIFKQDDDLYILFHHLFDRLFESCQELELLYSDSNCDEFWKKLKSCSAKIFSSYMKANDTGKSRNPDFEAYLSVFDQFFCALDNVRSIRSSNENVSKPIWYQIGIHMKDARKHANTILATRNRWKQLVGLTDEEYLRRKPSYEKVKFPNYEQTIPLSENPLVVTIKIDTEKDGENKIIVKGETNLFDKASLSLYLYDSNKSLLGRCEAICINGRFNSNPMGKEGQNMLYGSYSIEVILSIPETQDIEFVKFAGMQYENLTGGFIDRTGIGPTGRYVYEFSV